MFIRVSIFLIMWSTDALFSERNRLTQLFNSPLTQMLSVQLFSCFGEDEVALRVEEVVNLFIIRYVFHQENLVFDRDCEEKVKKF